MLVLAHTGRESARRSARQVIERLTAAGVAVRVTDAEVPALECVGATVVPAGPVSAVQAEPVGQTPAAPAAGVPAAPDSGAARRPESARPSGLLITAGVLTLALSVLTVIALLSARETRGESLHDDDVQAETAAVSP